VRAVTAGGAIAGGFVGTLILTTAVRTGNELGLTRIDLPFLLGTVFTGDRWRAKALGYALHFAAGLVFAMIYFGVFEALGFASWWLGAAFGALHGLASGTIIVNVMLPAVHPRMGTSLSAADTAPLLEPPGFLMLNYGVSTPVLSVIAHVAYGAVVGAFIGAQ
jgi:hypothetical protein